jgi:antibiotic biosynthesis monooxygenase (ABM) superfamily enzyme
VAVKLSRTSDERLELVNLRQAYLDELESRNALGFHTWLRSGAHPVGNPARYLALHEPYRSRPSPLEDRSDR